MSSHSVKSALSELESINLEIKQYKEHIKRLQLRKQQVESDIQEFISTKNQPGFKYNNTVVTIQKKDTIKRKTKKQRYEDQIMALEKLGITNPNEILQVIDSSRKGEIIEKEKIKVKSFKN